VKVFLRTFGCRANQYDSEAVRSLAVQGGAELVADPGEADVAIFNSCAVTASAEADLRREVRRAARLRPGLRTLVMGCAAGLEQKRKHDRSGEISVAGGSISRLPSVGAVVPGADIPAVAAFLGLPALTRPSASQSGTRALLRIQDGCDEHCTFCATTLARGGSRSRSAEELLDEASELSEHHPEIVLTGVHIGSYGNDIGTSLGHLLERLVHRVDRTRFRLSSLEATEVDDRLFELLAAGDDRVAPHLHAPLQSGSDRILRRMGRHWYTSDGYAKVVTRLAAATSRLGLGADVITGFPGEAEADHLATLGLIERLPFTYLHVFPYSPRPSTAASRLAAGISPADRSRRAGEIRAVGERKAEAYRRSRHGQDASIVVMRGGPEGREAITEDYLACRVLDPDVPGGVRVRATLNLHGDRLIASPAEQSPTGESCPTDRPST
jgi:threonylcarbamoyladenosine tRNA methylthiotransferase MtaB